MDPLSEVLATLRVTSMLSTRFEGHGAWAFHFPAHEHVKFGGVLAGSFHIRLDGCDTALTLQAGDFYMLTTGAPFCSASDLSRMPLDGPSSYRAVRNADGLVHWEGEPGDWPSVTLAGGRFSFEDDVGELLLRHLPPIIHLPAREGGATALSLLLGLLRDETDEAPKPGAEVARRSLAALVLVNALRAHLATTSEPAGWLGALTDPKIARALSLMHAAPAERWTLDGLAKHVGLSRTAFAARFRQRVGQAPIEYLKHWRMSLARSALRHSNDPLSRIAEQIGYGSDTAFSIAFKNSTGLSPRQFRAQARAGVEDQYQARRSASWLPGGKTPSRTWPGKPNEAVSRSLMPAALRTSALTSE